MGRDESKENEVETVNDDPESAELVLLQVKECYVYMIPPRKSAASYRADEWDINKWNWEGSLRVVSKGEECSIKLEDKTTGELYAQASVRKDYPLPVEAVIDSSQHARHAFIGLGFRERPEAYDFQAAIYDHMKYLDKKKEAEEMEQVYHSKPSMDYSLKEGETLRLRLKTMFIVTLLLCAVKNASGGFPKFGRVMDVSSLQEALPNDKAHLMRVASRGHGVPILGPPPPPLSPLSGSSAPIHPWGGSPVLSGAVGTSESSDFKLEPPSNAFLKDGDNDTKEDFGSNASIKDGDDDTEEDFGDFQAALL